MEIHAAQLQQGLPKIYEIPTCCSCHENKAFIVTTQGIVCGKCFITNDKIREDNIILEAQKILQARQCQ